MKTLTLVVIACLAGCTTVAEQVAGNTPSLQYCSEVNYERKGADFTVTAKCQLPIGGSALIVPPLPGL